MRVCTRPHWAPSARGDDPRAFCHRLCLAAFAECIVRGETGQMVEPDDVDRPAVALGNLLGDPLARAAMGMLARAWVHSKLPLAKQLGSLLQVIALTVASHWPATAASA
jgi:hypothetical protein